MITINRSQLVLQKELLPQKSRIKLDDVIYLDFMKDMLHTLANGNIENYRQLMEKNQLLNYDIDYYFLNNINHKCTTFHIAANNYRINLMGFMLELNPAYVNSQDHPYHKTPLHLLIENLIIHPEKPSDGFDLLIKFHANPFLRDKNGLDVFQYLEKFEGIQSATLTHIRTVLNNIKRTRLAKCFEMIVESNEQPLIASLNNLQLKILRGYIIP